MVRVFIPDNSSTKGGGITGLVYNSTNLAIAHSRELQNGGTEVTGANLVDITTIGTWVSPGTGKLGFKAVDAAKVPGLYEIHFPDDCSAFGSGDASQAVYLNIYEKTTTALKIGPNMALIPLDRWDTLTAAAVDAIHDEVVEGTLTLRQLMKVFLAVLAGKSAGGGTLTITFRDNADSKNRISATVDANGNRSDVTIDAS
jgi:hypothetical protein